MTPFVHARLVNGPFDDPGLFLDLRSDSRALLFDLGDVQTLSARELLRVSHVFVSHTHVDHFCGFDRLLRLCLRRDRPLHLTGPRSFIDRVEAKLQAYTWNLLDDRSVDFVLTASEFIAGRIAARSCFRAREAFHRRDHDPPDLPNGVVLQAADFTIEAAVLDHGTDCLTFALQEQARVTVVPLELHRLGLNPGLWLDGAKQAVRAGVDDTTSVAVGNGQSMPLGLLRNRALVTAPGQRVAYVVDAADTVENRAKIIDLARDADQLFIETAFANEDATIARARRHLTAGAAGRMARDAGVKSAVPLHFSTRYWDTPELLPTQFMAAFQQ